MLASLNNTSELSGLLVAVANDSGLALRLQNALSALEGFEVDLVQGTLAQNSQSIALQNCKLLVLELSPPFETELIALEKIAHGVTPHPPAIIVIGDKLDEAATRRLLKLNVADWLPAHSNDNELIAAFREALKPKNSEQTESAATSIGFMPVIGGAGATTLSIAAMEVLSITRKTDRSSCCVVDLNFQSATVADYLDLEPNLDLDEIADAPERLDAQLLEVMLSKHRTGFAALAAKPSLSASERIDSKIIVRLLDLAAAKFSILIIDMPPHWRPWCDNVLRGTDQFYLVTDMSVTGLRHARRLAQLISKRCDREQKGSVIVNKTGWLGVAGVKRQDAEEVLGPYLAGFLPDTAKLLAASQNQGVLLSESKPNNSINKGLGAILAAT